MSIDIEEVLTDILSYIGDYPGRSGLIDTPKRVRASWDHLFSGYFLNPMDCFKVFDLEERYDEMVLLKNIEFFSTCEHHFLPFFGKAHIAYIPGDSNKVIGVSKLARLLEIYSRRLQIQERIGMQITSDLMQYLQPKGAACILEAQHLCMMARGVAKQDSVMVTSSLTGCFKNLDTRTELLSLIKL